MNAGDKEPLVMATPIPDPTKSWAIYADLHEGGEAQYYTFDIHQGEAVHVTLLASTDPSEEGFLPTMALMGPGLQGPGRVPPFVQEPPGAGAVVLEGRRPAGATYEAFAPSSFYELADVKMEAPATGTYYIADVVGTRRFILGIPLLTPRLFSYWVDLVTDVPSNVARPLTDGLRNDVVCRDDAIKGLVPMDLTPYRRAVALALAGRV